MSTAIERLIQQESTTTKPTNPTTTKQCDTVDDNQLTIGIALFTYAFFSQCPATADIWETDKLLRSIPIKKSYEIVEKYRQFATEFAFMITDERVKKLAYTLLGENNVCLRKILCPGDRCSLVSGKKIVKGESCRSVQCIGQSAGYFLESETEFVVWLWRLLRYDVYVSEVTKKCLDTVWIGLSYQNDWRLALRHFMKAREISSDDYSYSDVVDMINTGKLTMLAITIYDMLFQHCTLLDSTNAYTFDETLKEIYEQYKCLLPNKNTLFEDYFLN